MTEYMVKRDYSDLDSVASWLNSVSDRIAELRESLGALYPDNSRIVSQPDFERAVNDFEYDSKGLIKAFDNLIP